MKKLLLSLLAGIALVGCTATVQTSTQDEDHDRHSYSCYHIMFGAAFVTLTAAAFHYYRKHKRNRSNIDC